MTRRHGFAVIVASLAACFAVPAAAFAQSLAASVQAGHCQIRIGGTISGPGVLIVQRDGDVKYKSQVRVNQLPITINVGKPISSTTSVAITLDGKPITISLTEADGSALGCSPVDEDTEVFTASGFVGMSIETFSAEDLQKYINPGASGTTKLRETAGVNFDYRLFQTKHSSFWISGETMHSVKSTDTDCRENDSADACKDFKDFANPTKFFAILRNATSLEASVGVRWHVLELNRGSDSPAAFYVEARLGFMAVSGTDNDAAELTNFSAGILAMGGRYAGSYLDVGKGKSEIYREHSTGRLKVDGLLSFPMGGITSMRPYIQMTIDADRGPGADSIQTFIGMDFDLGTIFKR